MAQNNFLFFIFFKMNDFKFGTFFPSDCAASMAVKGLTFRRQRRIISGRSSGQKTLKSKLMLCSLLVVGCYLCITCLNMLLLIFLLLKVESVGEIVKRGDFV